MPPDLGRQPARPRGTDRPWELSERVPRPSTPLRRPLPTRTEGRCAVAERPISRHFMRKHTWLSPRFNSKITLLRNTLQVRTQIVQILCPRQPLQRACTRNRSEERVRIQTWKTMENGGRPVRLCWTTTWVVVLQAASPCLEASRGDKIRRKNGVDTRL